VLVTGGISNNDATQKRVELIDFYRGGSWTCPDLPLPYFEHTQDTLPDNKVLLCGGFDTSTRNFCRQMEKGTFPLKPKHQFRTPWWDHISWTNKSGFTFVLGGERTSNLPVFLDPTEFKAVKAKYQPLYPSRLSCSIFIPETSQVIVTGGRDPTMKLVLVYNTETGEFEKKLPSLRQGRYNHGCTDYYSGGDRVLIVTGGQKNQVELLDSTEIFVRGDKKWETVGAYPKKVAGLRLTNFNGYVLSFGGDEGRELGDKFLNDIFQYNITKQIWEYNTLGVKQMIDRRSQFGLSVVAITDDIKSECDFVPYPFKGLFIASGAINGDLTNKTALYVPDLDRFCWLKDLDTVRRSHTTNQFTVCGGCDGFFCPPNKLENNCETFDPVNGTWGNDKVSLKTVGEFYNQSSWTMNDGAIYLIGGQVTNNSAIVKDGTVKQGVYSNPNTIFGACIINDPTNKEEMYILTGGSDGDLTNFEITRQVVHYNLDGPELNKLYKLPNLNFGRIEHGCAGYYNSKGGYVLLVTGGKPFTEPAPGSDASRTTETLDLQKWEESGHTLKWTVTFPGSVNFPFDYENSVAATINNAVYMFGLGNKGTDPIKVIRKWLTYGGMNGNWTDVYNFGFEWGSTNIIASNVTLPVGFNFDKYECYNYN